ncbi:MAG TPA: IPT/TIG domain-containing protein, partial [Acidimicrobiales bacterium]
MKQSTTRVSGKGKVARVLLVALLSLVGLSVIGVGTAYGAAPVVKALTPATGTADGGTTVVIGGSGFVGATSVTFGGVPATSFTVNTGLKITAVAPPAAANSTAAVAVVVTVAGVPSTPFTPGVNIYTYTWPSPPTVTGVGLTPASAPVQVGSVVTVTAAGTYTVGQLVNILGFTNGLPNAIYSVTSVGSGTFTVTNLGRTFVAGTGVVSPTPAGAIGPPAGGSSVVIVGTHLSGASSVHFGATPATSLVVNSSTQIT